MFEATQELAARVLGATDALASSARSSASWSAADRSAVLAAVRSAESALAEARAHLLVASRSSGDLERPGEKSFEVALGRSTRSGSWEATRQVRQADALVSMPLVAAGVRDGQVPLGHLDTLARVAATAAPEVAATLRSPKAQDRVVQMARSLSAPDFAKSLAQYVASKDPAAVEAGFAEQRRERYFSMSVQPHGVFLKGRLDVLAGETLRLALDAMGQFRDPERTVGQASADALVLLAERGCAGSVAAPGPETSIGDKSVATRTTGTVARPHLSLIVPAETFTELIAHQRAVDAACTRSAAPHASDPSESRRSVAPAQLPAPFWPIVAPATLEDGTPVPMSELARALCEADISRVVMSAEGQPLDVGRTRRLFTPAQRRAAVARDRQCVWNGCIVAASRCDVHHLRPWQDRGPTTIANAAILCRHHHRVVHQLSLSAERLAAPPGWKGREERAGRSISPGTSGIDRAPMRYVFRDPTGTSVNAPDGASGAGVDPAAGLRRR